MTTIIDNIELDGTNVEFNYASDFVKHTDRLVYLTGKAGTGKTTFLKYLRDYGKKHGCTCTDWSCRHKRRWTDNPLIFPITLWAIRFE